MAEREPEHRPIDPGERQPRTESQRVREASFVARQWLYDAFVLHELLAEHAGPSDEASSGFDFDERDVVVVDRKEAEEEHPTSKRRPAERERLRCERSLVLWHRQSREGREFTAHPSHAGGASPDVLGGGA